MAIRTALRGLAGTILMAMWPGPAAAPCASASPPGAAAFDAALQTKLKKALIAKGRTYKPRTRHLEPDGSPRFTNRLILEASPYLLQHAHNPVNWYPWGDEAFTAARRLGRPVLLSVGYSTCHWCHVMEEESFEDLEIARYLNENYVAIKVDREERPDIDAIYMSAVQAMNGSGGWPMTVWLDPAAKPFFGGAYFPPRDGDRGAPRGFLTLLGRMKKIYSAEPGVVAQSSAALLEAMAGMARRPDAGQALHAEILARAAGLYQSQFDSEHGGLRGAPKFPSGLPVRFLLREHRRTGDPELLRMAVLTLEKMAAGGIRDQVGGGFHRYSTDERWLAPHFEKMLYDNALLAMDYLEASQAAGNAGLAGVAREILRYVERDMTSPEGAFYSATDADSPDPAGRRKEGWYFTWTPAELEAVLGRDRARAAAAYYGVTAEGNFEGRSILHAPRPLAGVAAGLGVTPGELRALLGESNAALLAARSRRPPPLRDEKILASWNGLMISAFARASLALGEPAYLDRAARAASFILGRMRRGGRLLRSYQQGGARHNAYLDDYAFLAAGLLDLFEAGGDPRWLREALALDAVLESRFEDQAGGGFYLTSDDHERLIAREKPSYDGAEPSGNSVAVMNLLRLAELTGSDRFRQRAGRALEWFRGQLGASPTSLAEMLLALDFSLGRPKEIVIVTPRSRAEAEPFLARLRAAYVPNRVLAVVGEGAPLRSLAKLVPLVEGKTARNGAATAYVCETGVCELPATDPGVFAAQIGKAGKVGLTPPEKRAP